MPKDYTGYCFLLVKGVLYMDKLSLEYLLKHGTQAQIDALKTKAAYEAEEAQQPGQGEETPSGEQPSTQPETPAEQPAEEPAKKGCGSSSVSGCV